MRKMSKQQKTWKLLVGVLALVLMLGMFGGISTTSHAQSQGRVTATSAKIRSEASTSSETVGSAERDTVVTITGQTQGSDGYVWYQVVVNANTTGYIRSDLIKIEEEQVDVTKVNPVSATVKGNSSVRVRANASTTSQIIKEAASGTALTVVGQATGTDDKVWYQVNFISDGSQVEGFIRSDFVDLSAELTPLDETPTPSQEPSAPTQEPSTPSQEPVQEAKKYDTLLQNDIWYLVDNDTNEGWNIQDLFDGVESNAEAYAKSEKTVKSQKVVIIILVFLLVAAVAGAAFLVFKIKDMMDSAYFNEVEAETLRRRSAAASQGNRKVMHTVGGEKQGQRPAGAVQGQRPAGTVQPQRPAGTVQGQRPAGAVQGQRPAGTVQPQRPAGAVQGQRPAGAVQGQRPAGTVQPQRPAGTVQPQRPVQGGSQTPKATQQSQVRTSKNFMADDDDEFEFEFLNYDGEDEQ